MTSQASLMEELREIENVTDVNGCFLLRIRDNSIIESTIPVRIADDILWEIPVLRETFQQFSDSVNHGRMDQLILEGDKGFIFMYNLSPDFILLALTSDKIHLAYHTLGMLDILSRIKTKLEDIGAELLLSPAQVYIGVGEDSVKYVPKLITAENNTAPSKIKAQQASKVQTKATVKEPVKVAVKDPVKASVSTSQKAPFSSSVEKAKVTAKPAVVKPTKVISEAKTPVAQIKASASKLTPKPAAVVVSSEGYQGLVSLINDLSGKVDQERKQILTTIFDELKNKSSSMTGIQIADALDALKDKFLEFIGASVALFDISRSARDLRKIPNVISEDEAILLKDRVDNWASRLIK
jgi:predicted regulator of Ras-like GTPase activity (Roadblock/LC7/MglB family)